MRETTSAGEVDCHQCRVATTVATDRRCVIGKQIEREAEGRRSRLPSMLAGHGDGTRQASCDREADREGGGEVRRSILPSMLGGSGDGQTSAAWSSRSLQTSSGHGAIC